MARAGEIARMVRAGEMVRMVRAVGWSGWSGWVMIAIGQPTLDLDRIRSRRPTDFRPNPTKANPLTNQPAYASDLIGHSGTTAVAAA